MSFVLTGLTPGAATLLLIGSDFIWGREQDVTVNGVQVLSKFGWVETAGGLSKAVKKAVPIVVPGDGKITVTLAPAAAGTSDGHTWISAMAVQGS